MREVRSTTATLGLLVLCLWPGTSLAQDAADEVDERVQAEALEQARDAERKDAARREILSDQEFRELVDDAPLTQQQELEQQEQREEAEHQAAISGPTYEELHPREYKLYWRSGIRIERNDKQVRMKIGGRLQVDYAWIKGDSAIRKRFDTGADQDVRRAWLQVTGAFRDNLIYNAQIDLAGNSSGDDDRNRYIRQLYVGWTRPGTLDGVRVGFSKEPFTMDDSTSAMAVPFMERALPIVFAPSYNLGILVNSQALDRRVSWGVGGFRYSGQGGGGSRLDLTGRVTALPFVSNGDSRLLHVGASYSHQFRSDFKLRYRRRPESQLADRFVDTGEFEVDGVDLFGVELAGKWDSLSVQSELIASRSDRTDGPDVGFWGAYVAAFWLPTGEERPYRRRRGTFSRVAPNRPFSWKEGTWGALELSARFSFVDLDNRDIRGGTMNDTTLAASWILTSNYRIVSNLVHSKLNGAGNTRIIQLRLQVEY
jgi:phosphate-selective porin OprO/OprP